MLGVSERLYKAFAEPFEGTVRPVLLEHPRPGHKMSGFTDNYLRVELEAPAELDNCIVPVRLAGLSAEDELFKDCQLV